MCTKPEQKILPKILIFQEPGASSSPPDAEGLLAAREAHTHDREHTEYGENHGDWSARFLVTAR